MRVFGPAGNGCAFFGCSERSVHTTLRWQTSANKRVRRYGLGNIYYRQEKYDFSEHHLRKALAINPCSSPLYCYLGMALHANQKTAQVGQIEAVLTPTPCRFIC